MAQSGVRDVTFLGMKIIPESLVISITIFIMIRTAFLPLGYKVFGYSLPTVLYSKFVSTILQYVK